jgi:hypothetical protein
VIGAALSTVGQSADAFDNRLASVSDEAQRLIVQQEIKSPLERAFRVKLNRWLSGPRAEPIRPLHWALEFPEVMREGGFNAIVSNPPFIGGKKVSGALGPDYREYLKQRIANDQPGHADLCAYFLMRDLSIAPRGRIGIIATNTIAQGDTREVGLDQIVDMGWTVYRAEKSQRWPGTASLEVSLVWAGHLGLNEGRVLDGHRVAGITPALDSPSRVSGNPHALTANEGQSFIGSYILGTGFILEPEMAQELIASDPRNKSVVFPYLNGDDLNSRWDCSAHRWVIDFNDWPIERAMEYKGPFSIVDAKVRPERQRKKADGSYVLRNPLPVRWWQYADKRPAMRRAIASLNQVIAIARVSKTGLPQLVDTGQVMSEQVVVFATDSPALLCLLSSSVHYCWWTTKGESTLGTTLRYTPSDGFEKFPQPSPTGHMSQAGDELHTTRLHSMESRRAGLTGLYNRLDEAGCHDADIVRLREIHIRVDDAVRLAYAWDEEREPGIRDYEVKAASAPLPAWREIDLGHGFHETRQGVRFTISPQARIDVIDKLMTLNQYRYDQEVEQGLHSGKSRTASTRWANLASPDAAASFEDGGLFNPEGTLF